MLVDEDKHKQVSLIWSRGSTDDGKEKFSRHSEKKHLSVYTKIIRAEAELMTQCLRELLLFSKDSSSVPSTQIRQPTTA